MQAGEWDAAVAQLKASRWWHEVGQRGPEIAGRILAAEPPVAAEDVA